MTEALNCGMFCCQYWGQKGLMNWDWILMFIPGNVGCLRVKPSADMSSLRLLVGGYEWLTSVRKKTNSGESEWVNLRSVTGTLWINWIWIAIGRLYLEEKKSQNEIYFEENCHRNWGNISKSYQRRIQDGKRGFTCCKWLNLIIERFTLAWIISAGCGW